MELAASSRTTGRAGAPSSPWRESCTIVPAGAGPPVKPPHPCPPPSWLRTRPRHPGSGGLTGSVRASGHRVSVGSAGKREGQTWDIMGACYGCQKVPLTSAERRFGVLHGEGSVVVLCAPAGGLGRARTLLRTGCRCALTLQSTSPPANELSCDQRCQTTTRSGPSPICQSPRCQGGRCELWWRSCLPMRHAYQEAIGCTLRSGQHCGWMSFGLPLPTSCWALPSSRSARSGPGRHRRCRRPAERAGSSTGPRPAHIRRSVRIPSPSRRGSHH